MTLPQRMTTRDVEKQLGLTPTKLKFWVAEYGVDVPKEPSGAWRWKPEHVEALARIKTLRELDGRTSETVRRVLIEEMPAVLRPATGESPATLQHPTGDSPEPAATAGPVPGVDFSPVIEAIERLAGAMPEAEAPDHGAIAQIVADQLRPQLAEAAGAKQNLAQAHQALAASNQALAASQHDMAALAEKYAMACHRVAALEGEVRLMAHQLGEKDQKLLAAQHLAETTASSQPSTFWQRLFGRR